MLINTIKFSFLQQADFPHVLAWSKDAEFCAASDWEIAREAEELAVWWERCIHINNATFIKRGIEYQKSLISYAGLAEIHNGPAERGRAIVASRLWGGDLEQKWFNS